MKQIHRKIVIQNKDAKLFLFDSLPLENFKKEFMKNLTILELRIERIYNKFTKSHY